MSGREDAELSGTEPAAAPEAIEPDSADPDSADPDAAGPPGVEPDGRNRLITALRRPGSRGQVTVALLLAVLGFAAVTQVHANRRDDKYIGARQGDLIQFINNTSLASQRTET